MGCGFTSRSRIRSWKDVWCGSQAFELVFPRLFRILDSQDVHIVDMYTLSSSNSANWNFKFPTQSSGPGVFYSKAFGSGQNNLVV